MLDWNQLNKIQKKNPKIFAYKTLSKLKRIMKISRTYGEKIIELTLVLLSLLINPS